MLRPVVVVVFRFATRTVGVRRKAPQEMFTWRNLDCHNNHISNSCMFENGLPEGLMTQRAS